MFNQKRAWTEAIEIIYSQTLLNVSIYLEAPQICWGLSWQEEDNWDRVRQDSSQRSGRVREESNKKSTTDS